MAKSTKKITIEIDEEKRANIEEDLIIVLGEFIGKRDKDSTFGFGIEDFRELFPSLSELVTEIGGEK